MNSRVLLIDDSRFLRTALEKSLTGRGFQVQVAGDGEEALKITERCGFDLIVLDLFLPKITGHQVIKHLKSSAATASIPIVVLSGIAKDKELDAVREMGVEMCLPKTKLGINEIVASVAQCLGLAALDQASAQA